MSRADWLAILAFTACSKSEPPAVADKPKHEDRAEPAVAAPPLALEVVIAGATSTWNDAAFAKVVHYTSANKSGKDRETWSLRELAHQLVGPTARVVSVTGTDGTKSIDAASWDAADRTPILHKTRRGTLKFRWAASDGAWGDSETNDVSRLEITR